MRTYSPKKNDFQETWYLVDAKDQIVGRLATRVATILRGKHLPRFAPHMSPQTHVVIINAEKVRFTGRKLTQKMYFHHTGWPAGHRFASARDLLEKKPTEVLRHAIWGMLPKNRLGHATMTRVRIYSGPNHPHVAQNPQVVELKTQE